MSADTTPEPQNVCPKCGAELACRPKSPPGLYVCGTIVNSDGIFQSDQCQFDDLTQRLAVAEERLQEVFGVIRELRQRLATAGVEGSPDPLAEDGGTIPHLQKLLREAVGLLRNARRGRVDLDELEQLSLEARKLWHDSPTHVKNRRQCELMGILAGVCAMVIPELRTLRRDNADLKSECSKCGASTDSLISQDGCAWCKVLELRRENGLLREMLKDGPSPHRLTMYEGRWTDAEIDERLKGP